MKNIINKIVKSTASFVKAHTAVAIVTASAVVVTAVAVPVGIHMVKSNHITPQEVSSEPEKEYVVIEDTVYEVVSVEENTDTANEPTAEEPATSDQATTQTEQPTQQEAAKKEQATPSGTTLVEVEPSEVFASTDKSDVVVVQLADPETGISWDGVSPIIYTYPDGTTGTEKREGATYEQVPGLKTTVLAEYQTDYDNHCDYCGKIMGDGSNGTCSRWLMGDVTCPNCGVLVPGNTCHTCGQ